MKILLAILAGLGIVSLLKKRIFISYHYDFDKQYKNLLRAWDANGEFDFEFYDESIDVSVDSEDAAVIKRAISARIRKARYFLCLVGKETHLSGWVAWEIARAVELDRRIVVVKIGRGNTSPAGLKNVGASWALAFKFDAIQKAIARA